jgi:hypothetical protein
LLSTKPDSTEGRVPEDATGNFQRDSAY